MITAQKLSRAQSEQMKGHIDTTTRYLCKLYERMNKVGCPSDDLFRIAVERAYDAMRCLSMELHYIGCDIGAGRPPKE